MPVFVRHAACNMLVLLLATEQQQARNCHSWSSSSREWRIVQGPQSYSPRYVVRCFSLLLLLLLLWRHLNELQINFILVACASLRMEMMMDNNDATTGSPSPRPLRRLRLRVRVRADAVSILSQSDQWMKSDCDWCCPPPSRGTENPICSNSNWASASLNWFVCLHMHTPASVCVYLCACGI